MVTGRAKTVRFLRLPTGVEPVRDFLESLDRRQVARFAHRMREMANQGYVHKRKFKKVEGTQDLFEFKEDDQARVFCCFATESNLILLLGCVKRGQKLPTNEIKKAERLMYDFFEGERMDRVTTEVKRRQRH